MSEAVLGFKIDSSQATGAAADLDRLTASAARTQAAADKLEAEASGLGAALGRAGDGASKAKPAVDNLGKSFGAQDEHVRAFRMEVERLTLKYQPLAQATKQYEATVAEIGRAHKVGAISAQQMTTALDAERMAFERLKTSATTAGAAVKAANANTRAGANGNFATANVAAQFQDIAVTSAMGMNPLQIALQQGTQLSAVLGPMGAAGAVKGLGAAFLSVINPVSLVTLGLVAGTAALIQYFSAGDEGSKEMEADLERQIDLIQSVAARWGDAAPALKAYADELERARKLDEDRDAAGAAAELKIKDLSGAYEQLMETASRLDDDRFALSNIINAKDAEQVNTFRQALTGVNTAIQEGTDPTRDLNSAVESLATLVAGDANPILKEYTNSFGAFVRIVREAAAVSKSFREEQEKNFSSNQGSYDRSYFTDPDGTRHLPSDFMPRNPGVPGRNPRTDLSGDPDAEDSRILNSDGRLVTPGIPGQKPNFFELEKEEEKIDDVTKAYRRAQEAQADFWLDLSFQERQAGRSATDQKVASTLGRYGFDEDLNSPAANAIRQQIQQGETKEVIKGFFSDIKSGAMQNGGDIGKAIANAALNAASNAMDKAWESVFDKLATGLSNWLSDGSNTAGAGPVAAAFNSTTTLGGFLGANDNKTFAAPVGAVSRAALPPTTEIGNYIAKAAAARGIDPDIALRVAKSEGGLDSWNLQSNYVKNGVREQSYGPFQLYKGGGLGNKFMDKTGLDPALAQNGPAGVDFALDEAKQSGWGAWYGAKKAGIGNFEGIDKTTKAVEGLGAAATQTAQMTQGLGQTLASIPQALMANGGGSGLLSGLTKYGMGLFSGSGQFASAWMKGGIGLYANGTDYAPGGLAMVGERGPELVNLPQGSGVMSNHKLMSALAANNNGGGGGIAGVRVFVDQDGNWQAKVESIAEGKAKTTSQQTLGGYKQSQQRSGYGNDQKTYNARKG